VQTQEVSWEHPSCPDAPKLPARKKVKVKLCGKHASRLPHRRQRRILEEKWIKTMRSLQEKLKGIIKKS